MRRFQVLPWLIALLGCMAAAHADTLPGAPWTWLSPLDLACGRVGWRYEQGYTTWPGQYWRGPNRPPCAAELDQPASWGVLRLAGRLEVPPTLTDVAEAVAPQTAEQPAIDGVVGYEEWRNAALVATRLDEGQEIFLLLQRSEQTLYVCAAMPAVLSARAGQTVELAFGRAGTEGGQLCPSHLLLRATLDSPQHTSLAAFTGNQGVWQPEPPDREEPSLRACASSRGDAAWSYPVFEFALPLSRLRPPDASPEALGFLVRLQTFSRGRELPVTGVPSREAIYWPDSRTTYGASGTTPLGERPDFWGRLRLSPDEPQGGLEVPVATKPVRIDGQLGLKEWQTAHSVRYDFPGGQWRLLQVRRDEQCVYLGVRACAARGLRRGESCSVYLDVAGDGGLRPRSDDIQYRLPLAPEACPELLQYRGGLWVGGTTTDVKAAAYPFSDYESCYEFALPVSLFGSTAGSGGGFATPRQRATLAVEISYNVGPER